MAKKTILALELRTSVVRAAVVARARSGFSVLECVEVERPGTSDYDESTSLRREDVFAITKQLTRRPRNAVLVSASSINLAMDQTKFRNLKPTQVQEALRWEAEPFSGVPAQESMIGYERLDLGGGASRGKGDFALGSSSQMELQVTVFPLGEFQDDKRLMAAQGLRLQRIYAEEACFPVAAQFVMPEADKAVVQVEDLMTKSVRLSGGALHPCSTAHAGVDVIREHMAFAGIGDLEGTFQEAIGPIAAPEEKVIVCGMGGDDPKVVGFLGLACGVEAEPLVVKLAGGAVPQNPARFATAIGAGLRELGFIKGGQSAGVTDAVPFSKQMKDRAHIAPILVIVVLSVLFLFNHWAMMHRSRELLKKINALKTQKTEAEEGQKRYKALQAEIAALRKQKEDLLGQEEFLNTEVDQRLMQIEDFLDMLGENVSEDMSLHEVSQEGDARFAIKGEGLSPQSINDLAVALQQKPWCQAATLAEVAPQALSDRDERPVHLFRIEVTLAEGAKP